MRALAVLALVLAAALLPAVPAQVPLVNASLAISVDDPGHALSPGKNDTLFAVITYSPAAGAHAAPGSDPDPTSANHTRMTRVTFAVKSAPPWLESIAFSPPELLLPVTAGGGSVGGALQILVRAAPGAPALDKQVFVVTATAEPNGNVRGAAADSPEIKLKPLFVPKVNITAPETMIVPGGRWTDLPFTLKNLGNAETKVRLNVTARPQDSEVDYPATATIPANGSITTHVRLRLPWTTGESGSVELEAHPLTEDDSGRPVRRTIDVAGQSAVPNPWPGLLAIAAGAALLVTRRRA